ncbi:MICOS complex subunit MIC13 isoform X2 [Heterodontus francisci]|uniref:MICOS complex subunit MIC13 isoform X2 n=1 Tax=Heterodontus francisci TaxID=7792 RepID=UPI00355BCC6B
MAFRLFAVVKFFTRFGIVGGTMYIVYDQDLLGNGKQSCEILKKVSTVVPVAVEQWSKYIGVELPDIPKLDVPLTEFWNTGVEATTGFLSAAPTKYNEYTQKGWQYIKSMANRAE